MQIFEKMDFSGKTPLDRDKFFSTIKASLFKQFAQSQVNGISFILDGWNLSGLTDLRWLAYMLGTIYWETAKTFQPVKEYGNLAYLKNKRYFPYYGRGYVQLTWQENYQLMSHYWNKYHPDETIDLVRNPDLAQNPRIALFILFEGMTRGRSSKGDFTGKSLEDYFNNDKTDWLGARRIINGTDKAKQIAEISQRFYDALRIATGWK